MNKKRGSQTASFFVEYFVDFDTLKNHALYICCRGGG